MPVKTKQDEHKWQKAKEIAQKAGKGDNYAYIMGIYKRMKPDYQFKTAVENLVRRFMARTKAPVFVKTPKDKALWAKADELAKKQGHEGDYAYTVAIFKRMKPDYMKGKPQQPSLFPKSAGQGILSDPTNVDSWISELDNPGHPQMAYVADMLRRIWKKDPVHLQMALMDLLTMTMRRSAAQVSTNSAAIYAISPEGMANVFNDPRWAEIVAGKKIGLKDHEILVRQHGGAVFHTGGDGNFDVKIPDAPGYSPIVKEMGYIPPYETGPGTSDSVARVASRWAALNGPFNAMTDAELNKWIEVWESDAPEVFWMDGELRMSRRDALGYYRNKWRSWPPEKQRIHLERLKKIR